MPSVNVLDNKHINGNIAMKIDISKASDTIRWDFILQVLKAFGFSSALCNWISAILSSLSLSVSFNVELYVYFNCSTGVRQGDLLSLVLFCLVEDVLSQMISKAVLNGSLNLIKASKLNLVPFHTMYTIDILLICSGKMSNVRVLKQSFRDYSIASSQNINLSKSFLYTGSMSNRNKRRIINATGFQLGTLPFLYLGVPLFKGRVKLCHIAAFADKIIAKMSSWKGVCLSMRGLTLVKFVIFSMTVYSINIYNCPISTLKNIEKACRNFI